ncbi:MAG TPA: hypothetical protein VKZ18_10920, partial [Polyangia bacterium]|nr:hypothetical protein [Polyangia bacterium]
MRVYLCSAGSEAALVDELSRADARARALAPGVVATERDAADPDPVFSRQALPEAHLVEGASVRVLAEAVYGAIEAAIDRWPGPFAVHALAPAEPPPGLASRADLVAREALALLGERRRRASRRRRSSEEAAAGLDAGWLLVQILALDRDRFVVSAAPPRPLARGGLDLAPWPGGDAPVAIDRAPPSRAYQKLEEALCWLGTVPGPGDTCV